MHLAQLSASRNIAKSLQIKHHTSRIISRSVTGGIARLFQECIRVETGALLNSYKGVGVSQNVQGSYSGLLNKHYTVVTGSVTGMLQ